MFFPPVYNYIQEYLIILLSLSNMNKNTSSEQDIRRFLSNVYTRQEAEKVFDLLQDNSSVEHLDKSMSKFWDESLDQNKMPEFQRNKYKNEASLLLRKINKKKRPAHLYLKRAVSIAASIALLMIIGVGVFNYNKNVNTKDIEYTEVSTSFGQMETFALPDGTLVNLNACSHISFPTKFSPNERRVKLEGEAYFNVARNEKQPFIINTDHLDVKVLGTQFNVKAYTKDELISVSVQSGKVEVETSETMMRLIANEQIIINTLTEEISKKKEDQTVAVWRDGVLRFNETPIRDIANELERIYHCKITFKPDQNFDNLISGEHTNKSLKSVLKSLEFTSGIHYKYNNHAKEIILFKP